MRAQYERKNIVGTKLQLLPNTALYLVSDASEHALYSFAASQLRLMPTDSRLRQTEGRRKIGISTMFRKFAQPRSQRESSDSDPDLPSLD